LALLASPTASTDPAVDHFCFTLHTVTGLHRQKLQSYYGFICHPAELLDLLELPLVRQYPFTELYRVSPVNDRSL